MAKRASIRHFIFTIIFTLLFACFIIFALSFAQCFGAAARIPHIENYEIIRILIYGASASEGGETISAVISLLDTSGNECAAIERSWRGSSLAIDFKSAEFSKKKLLFPYMIYGRTTILPQRTFAKAGTKLPQYYGEHGKCLLLGAGSTFEDRRNLHTLLRFALNPAARFAAGFSRTYTVDLSRCATGVYYSITTGTDGTIELRRE
ncbi:MAG: hypothetical protein IJR50_08540 [Treponema sp.]|nr:hypothetical protein [Treponema sp.]